MKKIVVGVDGSPGAAAAARWARDEAALWGAELVVVHAWHYPYRRHGSPTEEMSADARQVLDDAVAALGEPEGAVALRAELVQGHAAEAVLDEASDADMIVVGSRGRGGFKTLLLGSVSHAIVQHATCPVAVVRGS